MCVCVCIFVHKLQSFSLLSNETCLMHVYVCMYVCKLWWYPFEWHTCKYWTMYVIQVDLLGLFSSVYTL